jgi:acid phosphatase (class A)
MSKSLAIRRVWMGMLAVTLLATAAIADSKWVHPGDVDFKSLLPATAPSNDTDEAKQDIAHIVQLQKDRTPEEVARCKSEQDYSVFAFKDVMGDWFTAEKVPVTAALMQQVKDDSEGIIKPAKNYYARPRPYLVDSQIMPCVKLEKSASFPSGHSVHATIDAIILAQIIPIKTDDLKARGEQIGDDRVIAGVHFPSDVAAGRVLGEAIAQKFLDNPDFMAELAKANAECMPFYRNR